MADISPELLAKRIQTTKELKESLKEAERNMYKNIEAHKKEEQLLYESGKIINGRLPGSVDQEKEFQFAEKYYLGKYK